MDKEETGGNYAYEKELLVYRIAVLEKENVQRKEDDKDLEKLCSDVLKLQHELAIQYKVEFAKITTKIGLIAIGLTIAVTALFEFFVGKIFN